MSHFRCICVFPDGSGVKNPPIKTGNAGDAGLIPGWENSLGQVHDNPLQCSCLENSMDRGVRGVAKSWTWLRAHTHVYLSRYTLYMCVLQTLRHYSNISHFQAYLKHSLSSTSPMVSFLVYVGYQQFSLSPSDLRLLSGDRWTLQGWEEASLLTTSQDPVRMPAHPGPQRVWGSPALTAREGSSACRFMISST